VFASLHNMGRQEVRTIGLARAQFQITTKLAVYNLKRWASLHKCEIAVFRIQESYVCGARRAHIGLLERSGRRCVDLCGMTEHA